MYAERASEAQELYAIHTIQQQTTLIRVPSNECHFIGNCILHIGQIVWLAQLGYCVHVYSRKTFIETPFTPYDFLCTALRLAVCRRLERLIGWLPPNVISIRKRVKLVRKGLYRPSQSISNWNDSCVEYIYLWISSPELSQDLKKNLILLLSDKKRTETKFGPNRTTHNENEFSEKHSRSMIPRIFFKNVAQWNTSDTPKNMMIFLNHDVVPSWTHHLDFW